MSKNRLITIEKGIELKQSDVIATFCDTEKLDPYIKLITDTVSVAPEDIDLSTKKGRDAIASRAHRVSKMKTALVKASKDSVADLKATIQAVSKGTKYLEESLATLRDQTRQPLTEWDEEQARIEEQRVAGIRERICQIRELGNIPPCSTIESLSQMIEALENIDCSEGFDEFAAEALREIGEAKALLSNGIQNLIAKEQNDRLREEQEQLEREKAEFERQKAEFEALQKASATEEPQESIQPEPAAHYEVPPYEVIYSLLVRHYGMDSNSASALASDLLEGKIPFITFNEHQSKAA